MDEQEEPPEIGRLSDNSGLWRASLWGGAATLALAAAVLITQTDVGAQRLQSVFASEPAMMPVTQADFVPKEDAEALKRETARLEAQVRDLAADREKLNARIATLEANLTDVTGSIKRELAAVAAKPVASPPVIAAPVSAPPAKLEPIEPEPKAAEPKPEPAPAAAVAPAPPVGEPVPLPPVRMAAVNPVDPAVAAPKDGAIGVDLGGARSLEIMQARWAAVKANFGPLLNGLHPLVAQDNRPNMIPYRLIVGPLPNAATAAQVCARFAASKVTCRSTRFAGDPLAMP
ncbi:MAG: hypothetical protein Q7T81_09060 [Pseudolabrys sp.]|nr:hypothetical protein [Pseudolabrys sp.]